MIDYVLFVHKKFVSKRKVCINLKKNSKFKKNPKKCWVGFLLPTLPGGGGGGCGGWWETGGGCAPAGGHRSPPLLTARSRGGTEGYASLAVILRYETPTKHFVSFISICLIAYFLRGACDIFSIYAPKYLFCYSNPFVFETIASKYSKTYPYKKFVINHLLNNCTMASFL
jgi:hypothetical protein